MTAWTRLKSAKTRAWQLARVAGATRAALHTSHGFHTSGCRSHSATCRPFAICHWPLQLGVMLCLSSNLTGPDVLAGCQPCNRPFKGSTRLQLQQLQVTQATRQLCRLQRRALIAHRFAPARPVWHRFNEALIGRA